MNKIVLVLAAMLAVSTPYPVRAQNNVNPVPADTGKEKEKPKPPTVIRGIDCGDACNHSGVTIIRGGAHPSITENPK